MTQAISNTLNYIRLITLVSSILIVIGSLGFYSFNSIPLRVTETKEHLLDKNNHTWIIQTITDRRLISTLVAAQASIFCPLFILLSPKTAEITESFVEMACQFLMPLGLALSWIFSILFDMKSTDIIGQADICLNHSSCFLFLIVYGLKYMVVGLFSLETCLITVLFFQNRRIQLPLDENNDIEKNQTIVL